MAIWQWEPQSRSYGNYGNANQWTVNAGMSSLARESAQNSNDARRSRDAPAELVYSLIRLTGRRRQVFEDAMEWDQLSSHLKAMGEQSQGAVTAGQIKANLEAMETAPSLVLLKVSDYGCRGLTGPEFTDVPPEEYGNFIKLCRLDLFSGKDQAAGGSFGLGKAVYWRFSRLQTVLFHSTLPGGVDGEGHRIFGVNQGVVHRLGNVGYQGRGCFGDPDDHGQASSVWNDPKLIRDLHLDRADDRPGTSALLVGFCDPDRPEKGLGGNTADLHDLASELREGIEESFWPLLARGGLRVRIEVDDEERQVDEVVNPEETYTELVRALQRFDANDLDDQLDGTYSAVVRDVPIKISRRRSGDSHREFVHQAKLIVTLSDAQKDSLENQVCLFRRPEMVVQTLTRTFESTTYHAFLLAGAAIDPKNPTEEDVRADDFLRYAEPPAHDRWIPGRQASQANLTAHYVAPWLPNLRNIEKGVLDALFDLFGARPPTTGEPPKAVMKHLGFLRGEQGAGGTSTPARKPEADIRSWKVSDGKWHVSFEVRAKNRPEGWVLRPALAFVGLDGSRELVDWESVECQSTAAVLEDGVLRIPENPRGRYVKVLVSGVSTAALPIPAEEAGIDLLLRDVGPLLETAGGR